MSGAIEPFKAKQEVGARAVCKVCGETIYDEYRVDHDDGHPGRRLLDRDLQRHAVHPDLAGDACGG